MGSWDELCLICGIAPSGGCSSMLHKSQLGEYARNIADEIRPSDEETLQIVRDALDAFLAKEKEGLGFRHAWLPEGMGRAQYSTRGCIAVGYFNQWGECEVRGDKVPDGRRVEVRRVRDCDSHSFDVVLREVDGHEKEFYGPSECSVTRDNNPNFALCEHCYRYLEAWLDRDRLPPSASSAREPLSFASELYEIVNSRTYRRDRDSPRSMLLQEINYDGIEETLEQWQDHFIRGRRGTKHLAKAIEAGLRSAELIPAVLCDCRAWMFMRTDLWPEPGSETTPPSFIRFKPATLAAMPLFGQLPNELLLPALADIPLQSILALASTCRSLHALIMQPSFLDRVLKESILRGSLRWVLPAETISDEVRSAYNALRLWIPEEYCPEPYPDPSDADVEDPAYDEGDVPDEEEESTRLEENQAQPPIHGPIPAQPLPSLESLVLSPHFPAITFVRACWLSDLMMNRKWLWGQVCKFREPWRDYRLRGWQMDRFFPSEEIDMANNQ